MTANAARLTLGIQTQRSAHLAHGDIDLSIAGLDGDKLVIVELDGSLLDYFEVSLPSEPLHGSMIRELTLATRGS